MSQIQEKMTDLELLQVVRYALCRIRNTKIHHEKAKDSYELFNLVEERIKELKQEQLGEPLVNVG